MNYTCLNSIRRLVECLGMREYGFIPEKSVVQAAGRELERHAAEDHGLKIIKEMTKHGPSYRFDFDILLRMILMAHGLHDFAATSSIGKHAPVMVAWTLDGAELTKLLSHVTAGIKVVDLLSISLVARK